MAERLASLLEQIDAALAKSPPPAGELEALCTAWQPKRLYDADPLLEARLKVCAGRAAQLAGRLDQALDRLDGGLRAALGTRSPRASALGAEARFYRAEILEKRLADFHSCAAELGLVALRQWESIERARVRDEALNEYRAVVDEGAEPWRSRAVVALAKASDGLYRSTVHGKPESYRGIALPSPVRVDSVDGGALLEASVGRASTWAREIERLYQLGIDQALTAGDRRLAAEAEEKLKAFGALGPVQGESLVNPLLAAAPVGVIRYAPRTSGGKTRTRFEQLGTEGRFQPLPDERALRLLHDAVVERVLKPVPGGAPPLSLPSRRAAWAAVALAEAGQPLDTAPLLPGLDDEREDVRVLLLRALEVLPTHDAYRPLVEHVAKVLRARQGDPQAYDKRFVTLARALFGEEERALLALRALVDKERDLVTKVTYEGGLPWDERAFLIAEIGDNNARYRVQELVGVGDDRTGAIALYALHRTMGQRSEWVLRQHSRGRMGCVAKLLLSYEDHHESRLPLGEGATP